MQKWEYLTVQLGIFTNFGGTRGRVAPQFVNGQELRDWKKISIDVWIRQLGEDGWEMTGTMSAFGTPDNYLFFKRPKP